MGEGSAPCVPVGTTRAIVLAGTGGTEQVLFPHLAPASVGRLCPFDDEDAAWCKTPCPTKTLPFRDRYPTVICASGGYFAAAVLL